MVIVARIMSGEYLSPGVMGVQPGGEDMGGGGGRTHKRKVTKGRDSCAR